MAALVTGDERSRGSPGRDKRMFVGAVLWIVRTGAPWRDLPEAFGGWNSAFRRFIGDPLPQRPRACRDDIAPTSARSGDDWGAECRRRRHLSGKCER